MEAREPGSPRPLPRVAGCEVRLDHHGDSLRLRRRAGSVCDREQALVRVLDRDPEGCPLEQL